MNKILRLSLIALLTVFCGGGVSADTWTFTAAAKLGSGTATSWTYTADTDPFTITQTKAGTSDINATYAELRLYKSHSLDIAAKNTTWSITSIDITCSSNTYATSLGKSINAGNTAVATVSGSSVGVKLNTPSASLGITASDGQARIKSITVTYTVPGALKAPIITPATGGFYTAQTITITQEDGKDIYYTTDGSDPTSSTTAKKYTATFSVSETTTIKAATKDGDKWSSVVTSTITIAKEYASFKELQENVTETSQPAIVNFKNAIVTAINAKGNNAYVVDEDGYGALIYADNHGFEAGDKITGKATGAFVLYTGKTEITGITSASEGLTITKGNTVPVTEVDIDELSLKEQSSVVKISGLTLDESTTEKAIYLTDGINKIQVYGSFMTLPTFEDNKTYTITGVVVWFNTTLEIAPRSEADIVGISNSINGITTDAANENAPIYNLAGQRVNKTAKGILIQNGKKFVNK